MIKPLPTFISIALVALSTPPMAWAQSPSAPQVMVPEAAPAAADASGRHTLNLKAADINVLIQTVSEITGRSFIVDPRVSGEVTVISAKPMDDQQVYEVFQSVLRVHGFAAVAAGGMVKIVPEAVASQDASINGADGGADALVTRVIEVRHVSAQDLLGLLRPLMPQQAQLAAHGNSNSLLVTDRAGNVDRLQALVRRIDTASDAEVEVIPLRHAGAAEVARTLGSLEQGGAGGTAAAQPGSSRMIADDRTNSILLSGDPAQRLRLRTLIAHLDTPLEGNEDTQVLFLRNAKATDLVPILEGVAATLTGDAPGAESAKTATIQAHEETNALIVTASAAVFRNLAAVSRQLDVRRAQVQVEAIIVDVSDELASEIGVQWQTTDLNSEGEGYFGGTNFPGQGGGGSIIGGLVDPIDALRGSGGLNLGYSAGTVTIPGPGGRPITIFQIGALVKALRGDTRANILSSPSIITLDHQEAQIKVVQEVPFLTGQYTNTSTGGGTNQPTNPFQTVDREDVGVILTVTPHVNEGDSVRLDLKQEISALAPNVTGAVDLITNKRELTTSVMVPDGGLLVLGGLTSEEASENVQGVPGLSRIPLLGNLFKSRSTGRSKRQLMIFLRPTILRDAATEATVSNEKYNYLRAEQLRLRSDRESRLRDNQPLLPELPPSPDLFRAPPPALPQPAPPAGEPLQ